MKKKCDYCGAFMNDTDRFCAVCGGPAEPTAKAANEPATIEELQQKAKLTLVSSVSIVEGGYHDVILHTTPGSSH